MGGYKFRRREAAGFERARKCQDHASYQLDWMACNQHQQLTTCIWGSAFERPDIISIGQERVCVSSNALSCFGDGRQKPLPR